MCQTSQSKAVEWFINLLEQIMGHVKYKALGRLISILKGKNYTK